MIEMNDTKDQFCIASSACDSFCAKAASLVSINSVWNPSQVTEYSWDPLPLSQ